MLWLSLVSYFLLLSLIVSFSNKFVTSTMATVATLRRRRGVVRASITRLRSRLRDLQDNIDQPETPNHARLMIQRLQSLDSEFKGHHYTVIESLESEEDLTREQNVLDEHDEEIAHLSVAIEMLVVSCATASGSTPDQEIGSS